MLNKSLFGFMGSQNVAYSTEIRRRVLGHLKCCKINVVYNYDKLPG